jgi:hypothetical protein
MPSFNLEHVHLAAKKAFISETQENDEFTSNELPISGISLYFQTL